VKRTQRITTALLRRWPLPALDPQRGKVSRGSLLVVGGSDTVPGAVTLAGLAGLRAGAGTLQIATTRHAAPIVAGAVPEARVASLPTVRGELAPGAIAAIARLAADCDAIVLGPGTQAAHVARAARGDATWVIDASAITGFSTLTRRPANVVLTPHPGEMASLCDLDTSDVLARCADLARDTAARLGCVVALKGRVTFIAAPDGRLFESTAGNHGLGTSGSGDVLAGVIAGLAARGADCVQAAVWGVHLHGRAGDALARRIGPLGYLARELLDEIPRAIARIER
jgi:ADP-dependent NAD(P)H-hydrate dehydratase